MTVLFSLMSEIAEFTKQHFLFEICHPSFMLPMYPQRKHMRVACFLLSRIIISVHIVKFQRT